MATFEAVSAYLALAICFVSALAIDDAPVCYPIVGCFNMSKPWHNMLRPFPAPISPENIATQFHLYTRRQPMRNTITIRPDVALAGLDFDGALRTVFVTHGFASSGNRTWVANLKNAILEKMDCNVIVVDWTKGSNSINYLQVASNTRVVAAETIRLVKYLIASMGADPSRLHLMGHSLGAHIFSYVSKAIPNIARITAFDPAQPGFEGYPKEVRLDISDAIFIDVIHTSARPTIPLLGLGMMGPVGHVDYYMNGGWVQPGCLIPTIPMISSLADLAKVPLEVLKQLAKCDHDRSNLYFTEALHVANCTFWGHKVDPMAITVSLLENEQYDYERKNNLMRIKYEELKMRRKFITKGQ